MVLDIIFAVLLVIAFFSGMRQGLIKSVWRLAAWIITIIAVYAALTPVISFLHGTALAENIYNSVYEAVSQKLPTCGNTQFSELVLMPEWIWEDANKSIYETNQNVSALAAQSVTNASIKIIAVICLFIIIRLALSILFRLLDGASKLPVISGANKLLGGVFSLINITIVVYLVLALVSLFANPSVYGYINETQIVKYLFNNNILMRLFMGI